MLTLQKHPFIILLAFLLFACTKIEVLGQEGLLSITSKIVDAKNNEEIPYANIYNFNSGFGSITNSDGLFTLNKCEESDSIRISYIGYKTRFFLASELKSLTLIKLETKTERLGVLTIYGEDTFLYELISRSKSTSVSKILHAKNLFSLAAKAIRPSFRFRSSTS